MNKHLQVALAAALALSAGPARAEGDDVSGIAVPEAPPAPSPAGALLAVPRVAVTAVSEPVRAGLTFYERYQVKERLIDVFFDDTRTFGIYPSVSLQSGARPGVGVRLVHKDLFGSGARLRLGADYGGEEQQKVDGSLRSPALFGAPLWLHVRGGWQRQPRAPFHGIGDEPGAVAPPSTQFGQRIVRGELGLEIDPRDAFFARITSTYVSRHLGDPASGEPTRLDALAGGQGARLVYTEALVGFDTLAAAGPTIPLAAPSTGGRVGVFGGVARGVSGDAARYVRYGLDAARYFDLYGGDRVLILRVHGEAARAIGDDPDALPFTDLPRLGGPEQLRGFARDRFRDRLAVVGSVEYRYPIWRQLAGVLFIDAGHVANDYGALGDLGRHPGDLRVGGGGGLEIYQGNSFLLRSQIAGSSEGLFFQLRVDAVPHQTTPAYRI